MKNKSRLNWFAKIHYGFTVMIIAVFPFLAALLELVKKEYDIALFFFVGTVFYLLYRYRDRLNFPYKEFFYGLLLWILFAVWVIILMAKPFYYIIVQRRHDIVFHDMRFTLAALLTIFVVIACIRLPDFIRLYTKGIYIQAKIINISVWAFVPRNFTELHFYIEFYDQENMRHLVIDTNTYVPRLEKWNIGDEVNILYDPKDPERWVWVNQ